MNSHTKAIGVFDSGMGGLTVLEALRERLPQESFVYLGDTARLPYGTKSVDTVLQYAVQMAKLLVDQQVKALVIACNTATTAALTYLQQILPDIPVIGVVLPGGHAAVSATSNQRIMVLATETTIASNAYQDTIRKLLPNAKIKTRSCSLLVALAEEGMVDHAIAEATLQHYLSEMTDEDTLLLGCTHFPVFKPLLQRLLPNHVQIVNSAEATAIALEQELKANALLNESITTPNVRYLVTDSVQRFHVVGKVFLGSQIEMSAIELVNA